MARGFGAAETQGLSRTAFQRNYSKAISLFSKTMVGLGYSKAEARAAAAEHIRTLDKDSLRSMGLLPKESPAAKPAGFGASEESRFNQLDRELEGIPENKQGEAMRFYEKEFDKADDDRKAYEANLSVAKDALKDKNFDWTDISKVSFIVPLSKEDSERLDGDYQAFLEEKWDEYASTSEAVADAEIKDREFEEDEGVPANERGNSEVEYLKGQFFKGLIGDLIDASKENRKGWAAAASAKAIIDRFKSERGLG